MRMYAGERPYTCLICEQSILLARTLKQHILENNPIILQRMENRFPKTLV